MKQFIILGFIALSQTINCLKQSNDKQQRPFRSNKTTTTTTFNATNSHRALEKPYLFPTDGDTLFWI
jgi:hypothetical protein